MASAHSSQIKISHTPQHCCSTVTYTSVLPHVLTQSDCKLPLLPSSSSGFGVSLQVQCSSPEYRLYSTTALAPDDQAGPDISLLSPHLQSQWDRPNNAHLGNLVIKPQSNNKLWWTCSQCPGGHTHKWLAAPNSRSARKGRKGAGCPFCANRKVCQHNSLHTKAPHLTPEWSEKNERSPSNFLVRSNKRLGGGVNAVVSGRQPSTIALIVALDARIAQLSEAGPHGNAIPH